MATPIPTEELDRVVRAVLRSGRGASLGQHLATELAAHGIALIAADELVDLQRRSDQYAEALHTPRSRGGLSAT